MKKAALSVVRRKLKFRTMKRLNMKNQKCMILTLVITKCKNFKTILMQLTLNWESF